MTAELPNSDLLVLKGIAVIATLSRQPIHVERSLLFMSAIIAICGCGTDSPLLPVDASADALAPVDAGADTPCSIVAPSAPDGGVCCPAGGGSAGVFGQCGGGKGGWSATRDGCCDPSHQAGADEPLKPIVDEHGCGAMVTNQSASCPGDASVAADAADGSSGDASAD